MSLQEGEIRPGEGRRQDKTRGQTPGAASPRSAPREPPRQPLDFGLVASRTEAINFCCQVIFLRWAQQTQSPAPVPGRVPQVGPGRLGGGGTSVAVCSEVSRRDERREPSPPSRQAPRPQGLPSSVAPLFPWPLGPCSPRRCCCPFPLRPSLIGHLARPIPGASLPFPLPPVTWMTEGYLSNKINRVRAIFRVKPVITVGSPHSVLQLTKDLFSVHIYSSRRG